MRHFIQLQELVHVATGASLKAVSLVTHFIQSVAIFLKRSLLDPLEDSVV